MSVSSTSCAKPRLVKMSSNCSTKPTRPRRDRGAQERETHWRNETLASRRRMVRDRRFPAPRSPAHRLTEPPMNQDSNVARRQVEITNTYGLHLRPADK